MKLQSAAIRYVEQRTKSGRFRGQTPRVIERCLLQFCAHVGDIDVSRLRERHVRSYLEDQHGKVLESTICAKYSHLAGFCRWLVRFGHLESDPCLHIDPPKKPESIPRAMSPEETEKLFANLPDIRAELVCSLIFQSALRIGEVASLEVGWVDFTNWQTKVRGKGDKERVVPIFAETQSVLLAYLQRFPARSGLLIRSYTYPTRGLGAHHLSRLVAKWMYEAGIKRHAWDGVSAHAGRHTAATDTYEQSKDIRAVQQFLGHASLNTTQMYLKGSVAAIRAAGEGRKYRR